MRTEAAAWQVDEYKYHHIPGTNRRDTCEGGGEDCLREVAPSLSGGNRLTCYKYTIVRRTV